MFEQKDMSGALFKNDERTEENNQPNAKGRCKLNGIDYFVSAWTRVSQGGVRYMALAFQVAPPWTNGRPEDARDRPEDFEDPIPF